jgi:tRNA threonylcarbamoyladenosine biosynthesis protein TsaB
MTCLLALDTSSQTMAVALVWGGEVLAYDGVGGAGASGQLITQAQQLMAQAGLTWSQLDAIAFGRGPGAFTGLRTACSVAQGLALGADKPVLSLDSLMLVAQDAYQRSNCFMGSANGPSPSSPLWAVSDARMGEVYAAQYQWQGPSASLPGGHWQVLTAPHLRSPAALLRDWSEHSPGALAGNALLAFAEFFSPAALPTTHLFPQAQIRASALAAVARQAWASGETIDAAQALPLYVRDKVAQTMLEREHARLATVDLQ